jgi:hypothetical protein
MLLLTITIIGFLPIMNVKASTLYNTNTGFETGDLTGWETDASYEATVTTTAKYTGTYGCTLTSDDDGTPANGLIWWEASTPKDVVDFDRTMVEAWADPNRQVFKIGFKFVGDETIYTKEWILYNGWQKFTVTRAEMITWGYGDETVEEIYFMALVNILDPQEVWMDNAKIWAFDDPLKNGGFESAGQDWAFDDANPSTTSKRTGSYGCELSEFKWGIAYFAGSITQTIAYTYYELSSTAIQFYMKSPTMQMKLTVTYYDDTTDTFTFGTCSSWTKRTVAKSSLDDKDIIKIKIEAIGYSQYNDAWIDDVKFNT